MDTLRKFVIVAGSLLLIWLATAMVAAISDNTGIQDTAVILAFLATLLFGMVAGFDSIGRRSKETSSRAKSAEKAKRDVTPAQDARLDLLLALLSSEERESLKHQLIDDLTGEGEVLSLADLLAAQEAGREYRGRS